MEQRTNSAKFAFFYILSLIALVFVAISVGTVVFQIINKNIADIVLDYSGSFSSSGMKYAISALVVATPIYFLTAQQIYKNLRSGNMSADSGVRKWLTYLILLVAVVVMIGWLIALLNSFLGGELTTKFVLKALTALIISGVVFFFYLHDIRRDNVSSKDQTMSIYTWASLLVIIAVFITALFYVESPSQTRNRRIDERVLSNFSQIQSAVNDYYNKNNEMPSTLDVLKNEYSYVNDEVIINPATGQMIEYSVLEGDRFELCTEFMSDNRDSQLEPYKDYYAQEWPHAAGRDCIQKTVQIYPGKAIDDVRPLID